MGKQFCKTLYEFSDMNKYKFALKELELRHQNSMILEPIDSPIKNYIAEDMLDKRPTHKSKKNKDKNKDEKGGSLPQAVADKEKLLAAQVKVKEADAWFNLGGGSTNPN